MNTYKKAVSFRFFDLFVLKNVILDMLNLKRQRIDISLMLCFGLSIISLAQQYFDDDRQKWTFFIIPFGIIFLSLLFMWFLVFRFLIPQSETRFMYRKRDMFIAFGLSLIVLFFLALLGFYAENYFFGEVEGITLQRYLAIYLFRGFFLFGLVLLFKYLIDNRDLRKVYLEETEELREANTYAQFEILKQQINPHFLFNSLSTLKSLIRIQDPNAENFVMNLSDLYRKLLQRRDKEFIRLHEEMEIVNSYLFMQKMRFEDNLKVEIAIDAVYENMFLPPFALQLLIENVIKHNVISRAKPLTIRIFTTDQKRIIVENAYRPKTKAIEVSTGWGLSTLTKRFSLFTKEPVIITKNETIFSVSLPLLTEE